MSEDLDIQDRAAREAAAKAAEYEHGWSAEIDYQDAYYYAEPKQKKTIGSLDELDPEILRVYEKLGIPIEEQKVLAGVEGARKVAVDAVFDSVSVATTFRKELEAAGVIFRSISEAIRE